MHFGNNNPGQTYHLNGQDLSSNMHEKDLGITICSDLKPSKQVANAVKKKLKGLLQYLKKNCDKQRLCFHQAV